MTEGATELAEEQPNPHPDQDLLFWSRYPVVVPEPPPWEET